MMLDCHFFIYFANISIIQMFGLRKKFAYFTRFQEFFCVWIDFDFLWKALSRVDIAFTFYNYLFFVFFLDCFFVVFIWF